MVEHLSLLGKPRFAHVARQADKLVRSFTVPPIPILEIAEQNGVHVEFTSFDQYDNEVAGLCDFEAKKLYVNQDDPVNRQTFTIAHELGHWVLHRDFFLRYPEKYPFLPRFQSPDRHNPLENEANFFAANILVPNHLLKPIKNSPVSSLCLAFQVSKEMMEIRLKNVR